MNKTVKEEWLMYKKILSLATVVALCLSLCPVALAEGETELPRLGTPTELAWGIKYLGNGTTEDIPGYISWVCEEEHQAEFDVCVYNTASPNEPLFQSPWSFDSTKKETWFSVDEFAADSNDYESGTYYFTIQALGDGVNYADGEVVRSENWEYVKPADRLSTPDAPTWMQLSGRPAVSVGRYWGEHCGGLYTKLYFSATPDGEIDLADEVYWERGGHSGGFTLPNWVLSEHGPGYYRASTCAVSEDITRYQNSEWSELGEPYNYTSLYDLVNSQLDAISEDATPQEIRSSVKYIGALSTALAADQGEEDGVAAKLAALEERTGVTKAVEVDETLEDTFAAEKVNFVGAALNDLAPDATQVKLTVSPLAGDTELVIPTLYNDTVVTKFSMDVEGVADTSDLAVPVRITLPIPTHINPAFLVILHYDSQGKPQVLTDSALYTYQEDEQWMVSFVVEHFSDFVFTETKSAPLDPNAAYSGTLRGDWKSLDWVCTQAGRLTLSGAPADGEAVLAAQYDGRGQFLGAEILDADRRSAQLDATAARVALFWLDARQKPVSEAGVVWEK